jgi:hypothetical protein
VKAELMEAQYVAVEEADRGLVWTCGAAFAGEDVIHAHGIQMIKNRKAPTGFKDAGASSVQAERCCAAYAINFSRFRSVQKNVPCSS